MTLVAIHQPTFLPWLGWWDKFVRCDVFVLLDDVQFPKKGGTWVNRVRLLVNGEPWWVTVPVDRTYHGFRSVREMLIDEEQPWRRKIEATIKASYGSAPHFEEAYPPVEEALHLATDRIAELNEAALRRIAQELDLDTAKLVRQSDLGVTGRGTDLLVAVCQAVGGDAYLTGDGAGEYFVEEVVADAGLAVVEQRFDPPRYPQLVDEYVPGLSVVDALMNCGWEGTAALLSARVRRSR
jgi:WbqC-like protein family